jgi:O-antigen/teichoic acid export membrane protein
MIAQIPRGLLTKGVWAVTDQGLFAVSNFSLNVMLARWLPAKDYGAFAAAFTVFLLVGTFHTALLTEPMLVFGPGRYRGRLDQYLNVLLSGHWGVAALGGLLLGLAGLLVRAFGPPALSSALLGFALASPLILLLWFMRRACYIRLEPHLAASGGFVYLILMLIGLLALYRFSAFAMVPAIGVMALASLIASLWLASRLCVSVSPSAANALAWQALRDHWGYGRWSVATMALGWVPGNVYYLLLPLWQGLEAGAALKAVTNLILPIQHMHAALGMLLVPTLVRSRDGAAFDRVTQLGTVLLTAGSLAYWMLLIIFHRPVMAWLYGGQYAAYTDVLWLLGIVLLAGGVVGVLGGALRALERPDQVCRASWLSTVVVLTVGVAFMMLWGVTGAGLGLALSSVAKTAAMWVYYRRSGGSHAAQGAPGFIGATHVL